MRHPSSLLVCVVFGFLFSACGVESESPARPLADATPVKNSDPAIEESVPVVKQEQDTEKKPKVGGLLDMAGKLLDKVDDSNEPANKAKQWMGDTFGNTGDRKSQIDDAAKWAADAFKALKEKGMTNAGSPAQWLQQDIRNMNALQYKIVTVAMDDWDAMEDELNKLGERRWDCFHVAEKGGETVLFFKKERRSLLKNIPVNDMMKLVPLMGDGQ